MGLQRFGQDSDETVTTAHFTTQDTEAQRNKQIDKGHGSCPLVPSYNQVLPLEVLPPRICPESSLWGNCAFPAVIVTDF